MTRRQGQLPEGWEVKKLVDVAKATYGYTESACYYEVGPKFLRITDIQNGGVNWDTVPFCKISDIDLDKYALKNGDIVFARTGATTGKSYLVQNPPLSVFASYLIKVHITYNKLTPEYLFLFFQTKAYWDTINAGVSGSAQGGFNATKLSELYIPLPPLPEQKRIIAILDETFAAIDKAKSNAVKNLANAKELFESYLQGVFAEKGEDWEEKKLGEVCEIKGGGTPSKSNKSFWNGDIPWVSPKDMKKKDISDSQDHISQVALDNSATNLIPKDALLIVVRSGILVHTIPFGITRKAVSINQDMKALIPSKKINTEYLYYHFCGIHNKLLAIASRGATVHRIPAELLENIELILPSLSEQKHIVTKLDALSTETKRLVEIYKQKIASLNELKKSILDKAFKGAL